MCFPEKFIIHKYLSIHRLPRHVLCEHTLRHNRARQIVGPEPILWPFHVRAQRGQAATSTWTRRGLWPVAAGQPQMQIGWGEDEQDRLVPRLLSTFQVRGGREVGVPRNTDGGTGARGCGHDRRPQSLINPRRKLSI